MTPAQLSRHRLRLAAAIRLTARRHRLSIRSVYRRVEVASQRRGHRRIPWGTVEAFEEFCAGRRHRGEIEAIMDTMEAREGIESIPLAMLERVEGIVITSHLQSDDGLLRQEEGESFYRRALAAYVKDLDRYPGRERSVTHRYAKTLWLEVSPYKHRRRSTHM